MQPVLDPPVASDPGGQHLWWCLGVGGRGDQVHDLHALLALDGDGAAQLGDLGPAREPDPGRGVDDLNGAGSRAGRGGARPTVSRSVRWSRATS